MEEWDTGALVLSPSSVMDLLFCFFYTTSTTKKMPDDSVCARCVPIVGTFLVGLVCFMHQNYECGAAWMAGSGLNCLYFLSQRNNSPATNGPASTALVTVVTEQPNALHAADASGRSGARPTVRARAVPSFGPDGAECPICLEDDTTSDGSPVIEVTTCGHRFHASCLEKWCNVESAPTGACPVCRQDMVVVEDMGL